jgi:hypothetical protein
LFRELNLFDNNLTESFLRTCSSAKKNGDLNSSESTKLNSTLASLNQTQLILKDGNGTNKPKRIGTAKKISI